MNNTAIYHSLLKRGRSVGVVKVILHKEHSIEFFSRNFYNFSHSYYNSTSLANVNTLGITFLYIVPILKKKLEQL